MSHSTRRREIEKAIAEMRLGLELQAARDALHGLVVAGMMTAEQEASVLVTANCYVGWEMIDYIQRVVDEWRRIRG